MVSVRAAATAARSVYKRVVLMAVHWAAKSASMVSVLAAAMAA